MRDEQFECKCFPVGHPAHGARHKQQVGCDKWKPKAIKRAGARAFAKGGSISDCPYRDDSAEWSAWVDGFSSAPATHPVSRGQEKKSDRWITAKRDDLYRDCNS